ncbi:hypothetical protein J4460_01700 [Candidatus Woesearchaeota archaeon]|nr:MAG: hypothetical protein QS99_C0003G0019 [archaeon GW2011_AR4]MBS3129365.1 hypothetical protein [Candidatus Woesearchaeota archaeon]HIH48136.1 hypothetical protein [Candidatus Woesearchaeota archaeon]HIJ05676.1 hypothetical protein [Nanoarchaeota archaeon]
MAFNPTEKKLLNNLYAVRGWVSTRQIADRARLSWETADKYLKGLSEDDFVLQQSEGKKSLWKFNFDKWSELRKKSKKI